MDRLLERERLRRLFAAPAHIERVLRHVDLWVGATAAEVRLRARNPALALPLRRHLQNGLGYHFRGLESREEKQKNRFKSKSDATFCI